MLCVPAETKGSRDPLRHPAWKINDPAAVVPGERLYVFAVIAGAGGTGSTTVQHDYIGTVARDLVVNLPRSPVLGLAINGDSAIARSDRVVSPLC